VDSDRSCQDENDVQTKLLACPECKSSRFYIYTAKADNFFFDGKPLVFTLFKCIRCGWESHPRSSKELNEIATALLKGDTQELSKFSFVEASEEEKIEFMEEEITEKDINSLVDALEVINQTKYENIYKKLRKTYQKIYDAWIAQGCP